MTTRFSQRRGVQTLPPVCRATTIIPITWELPPYPDLWGWIRFSVRKNPGVYYCNATRVVLNWHAPTNHWGLQKAYTDFYLWLQVFPYDGQQPTYIRSTIQVYPAFYHYFYWYGPNYTENKPWESGLYYGKHIPTGNEAWQSLATWIP